MSSMISDKTAFVEAEIYPSISSKYFSIMSHNVPLIRVLNCTNDFDAFIYCFMFCSYFNSMILFNCFPTSIC
jgi:hypothetical protein